MTIYRLQYDAYEYPRVDISMDEIMDKLPGGRQTMVKGKSRKDAWVILNATYYYNKDNPEKPICPDISKAAFEMVFSQKAKDELESVLGQYGEFLPVSVEGETRYLFNLLNSTDAIDPFNSKKEICDGIAVGIEKIAFLEHEVRDLCIFNTAYDGYSCIYCTDEFKDLIGKSGLTSGWSFEEALR